MSKDSVIPSRFYFVSSDTLVEQCIRVMQENSLSYLLVENKRKQLVGIFTLKDFLKSFTYLRGGAHLKKPVNVVMTRPVITLPASQIHKAAKLMLKNNFRHLPITSGNKNEGDRVIGVVDVESVLRGLVDSEKSEEMGEKFVSVYSQDGSLMKVLTASLKGHDLVEVDKMWVSKLKTDLHFDYLIKNYDLFFFDIVDERSLHIAHKVALKSQKAKKKTICLFSKKHITSPENLKLIQSLGKMSRVKVYEKPTNIHDLVFECIF